MGEEVWGTIEAACEAGEPDRVVDLCLPLDEATRGSLSAKAAKLARRLRTTRADWRNEGSRYWIDRARGRQASAGRTAVYCLGPPSVLAGDACVPFERMEEVVRARPRAWRDGWADQVVEHQSHRGSWRVLRTLILEGGCAKPSSLAYARMMIDCVDSSRKARESRRNDPYGGLLADPDLLEDDVWRIFEIEEKILSLGWYDWDSALIRLAEDGVISRDRLLNEALAALRRDFPAAVAATFSKFYDLVKPTPDENSDRVGQFLDLLASPSTQRCPLRCANSPPWIAAAASTRGNSSTTSNRRSSCGQRERQSELSLSWPDRWSASLRLPGRDWMSRSTPYRTTPRKYRPQR